MAKVAWKVFIQPKIHGGLDLIHPLMQSRALLIKFVIRGLLLGSKAWKGMFLNRLVQLSPKTGGFWSPSLKWLQLLNDVQTPRWDALLNPPLLANSLSRDNQEKCCGLELALLGVNWIMGQLCL